MTEEERQKRREEETAIRRARFREQVLSDPELQEYLRGAVAEVQQPDEKRSWYAPVRALRRVFSPVM